MKTVSALRPLCFLWVMLFSSTLFSAPLLQRDRSSDSKNQEVSGVAENRAELGRVRFELQQQIEMLQMEIQKMRGIIEEQNYTIEQLRKGERERYADLDNRIRQLNKGSGLASGASADLGSNIVPDLESEDEKTYKSAKQKVDNKEFNAALAEFTLYLEFFPEGKFVAQTHYWMGDLYMNLEIPEYENAITHFNTVIKDFPEHAKVAGCHYKLGVIYKAQGKNQKAKQHFETVVNDFPESSTASLASNQLSSL